jgi:hypothetical protein
MSEHKRVRITSDGGKHPSVIDVDTGQHLLHIVSVDWHASWQDDERGLAGPPTATIKVLSAEIDVETGAEVVTVCPRCGKGDAIEELRRLRAENLALREHVGRLERGRRT